MAQVAITKTEFQNNLSETLKKDDEQCKVLVKAYRAAETCAKTNILVKEHILEFDPSFFSQVENGIADLQNVDRPILVIGETSAGKSSFLNLLIGRKVLPELAAPCTHCMCSIKKGKKLEAHVTSFDGSKSSEVQIISGDGMTDNQFRTKLEDLVNEDNCSQALNRCIDIFVPSDILEESVYLVDTPGFGESAQITKSLVRFLPKAIGIIFILNTTVSLGIADDRILDEIKRLKENKEIPSFEPSKVLFIANKWDDVPVEERGRHRQKIIKKMETFWPDFSEDQLLPLSVKHIRKMQDNPGWDLDDYTSAPTDYRIVLDKIRGTVQHCASVRSSVHSRYIDKFLKYLKTCLDTVENFSGLSSKDKKVKASILQTLIAELESTYEQEKRNIDAFRTTNTSIAERVHKYLNDAGNKDTIFNWTENDIPNCNSFAVVKVLAQGVIYLSLSNAIDERFEEYKSAARDLICTQRITEKEAKMERFLKAIGNDNVSAEETTTYVHTEDHSDELSKASIAAIAVTAPLWIPLSIAGAVTVLPVALVVLKVKDSLQLSKYKANKMKYLNRWTQEILKHEEFTLTNLENTLFDKFTEEINKKMTKFLTSITSYKHLLRHLDPNAERENATRGYAEMRKLRCHLDDLMTSIAVAPEKK